MDVEGIQKINNLATDLIKQGLAQNRDEAITQAEKIFRNQDSEEYNSMKETLNEVEADKKEVKEEKTEPEMNLPAEKIKDILEQNTKFLVKTIKEFKEKINDLENELTSLKTKITYKNLPTANEIKTNTVEEVAQVANGVESSPSKTAEVNNNNQVPKNHPRSGDFKDEDVSIEEFFYMGNK